MKKEDSISSQFNVVYVPNKTPKLTDNVITDSDLEKYKISPFDFNTPIESKSSWEESYVKSFLRGDLQLLQFKPYKNLSSALKAIDIYTGYLSHSLKLSDNLDDCSNNLISMCFLLKFLETISTIEIGKEFKARYFLEFSNKLLWDEYRWRLRYNKEMYKFSISSGAQSPSHGKLHTQVYNLLRQLLKSLPSLRAEDFMYRVFRIAQSTSLDDGL